jgi:hypothetical protein
MPRRWVPPRLRPSAKVSAARSESVGSEPAISMPTATMLGCAWRTRSHMDSMIRATRACASRGLADGFASRRVTAGCCGRQPCLSGSSPCCLERPNATAAGGSCSVARRPSPPHPSDHLIPREGPLVHGLDGAFWTIEGGRKDVFRATSRWSPWGSLRSRSDLPRVDRRPGAGTSLTKVPGPRCRSPLQLHR